jgi:hypothetical protein
LFTGWWLTYPSEKYEFVSWQDDIPNTVYGKKKGSKPPASSMMIIMFQRSFIGEKQFVLDFDACSSVGTS